MVKFLSSETGHLIARNGILAIILAYSLYVNKELTQKLFLVIENNTAALVEFKESIRNLKNEH